MISEQDLGKKVEVKRRLEEELDKINLSRCKIGADRNKKANKLEEYINTIEQK